MLLEIELSLFPPFKNELKLLSPSGRSVRKELTALPTMTIVLRVL